MIGQEKLLEKINKYTVNTLPRSILFVGESGCGKHTIVNYISNKLNLPIVEIDEAVDDEKLIEYQQDLVNKIYLINLDLISEKQQNKFLKFIEEPTKTCHIICITTSTTKVIGTILNRCLILNFEKYHENQLKQIRDVDNKYIYKVCNTPGQVLNIDEKSLDSLYSLCYTILTKLNTASYANTMSISTKINYKDENDKYDLPIFLNMLRYVASEDYIKNNNVSSFNIYAATSKYAQKYEAKNLAKEQFMFNFLTYLWNLVNN